MDSNTVVHASVNWASWAVAAATFAAVLVALLTSSSQARRERRLAKEQRDAKRFSQAVAGLPIAIRLTKYLEQINQTVIARGDVELQITFDAERASSLPSGLEVKRLAEDLLRAVPEASVFDHEIASSLIFTVAWSRELEEHWLSRLRPNPDGSLIIEPGFFCNEVRSLLTELVHCAVKSRNAFHEIAYNRPWGANVASAD